MKKMMTAFAACMIAGLVSAQIESANIVGYQTVSLNQNQFTHVCPTFTDIGGAKQIVLNDLTGDMAELDSIQFMDPGFATQNEYFYLMAGSLAPEGSASGWYDTSTDPFTPAGNAVIPAGVSVLYSSQGASQLTFAGEVNAESVVISSEVGGFKSVGNPFPTDTTLGAISFTGVSEMCSVQIMDAGAATAAEYFWLESGSLAPEGSASGWYDTSTDPFSAAGSTVIAAGQGFLFNEQGAGTTISFTSPL